MYRRICLTFSVVALLVVSGTAFAAPELSVDQPVYDFGTIIQGKRVEHVFILKNRGDTPLTVTRTKTSCGCTVANMSTKTIAPGRSAELRTAFDSANFGGTIAKTITIDSNDPRTPAYTLTLKGVVKEQLVIVPRQLNLGQLKAGADKELALTLENKGERTVRLISVTSPLPQVKITLSKQFLKPNESARVNVIVRPKEGDRFLSGFIVIATDSPGKSEVTVPLYGSVAR